jgi:hypothetical protein
MTRTTLAGVLILVLSAVSLLSRAETSGSLASLKISPDARSAALGETGVAGSSGAMTLFHNPALTGFAVSSQASFGYTNWLLDLSVQTGSLLLHYDKFNIGLSFNVFTEPGIQQRNLPSDNPLATFSAHDMTAGLSLGIPLKYNLSVGVTGHFVYQKIYNDDASGVAADFGLAWRQPKLGWTIAACVRNAGKMGTLQQEASPLPTSADLGMAGIVFRSGDLGLRAVGEGQYYFDDDLRLKAGLEGFWKEIIFLRAGYQTGSELRTFSGGAGIAWKRYSFDYAYQPLAEDFGASHRFTVGVNF